MFIKEVHIMIEQGLQNIGVFAHSEVHPEEVDLRIKKCMWEMLERDFPSDKGTKINKPKIDKYSVLLEKEKELSVKRANGWGDIMEAITPDNYFHAIRVDAVVVYNCGGKHAPSGQLVNKEWYMVLGEEIEYKSFSLPIRTIFQAVDTLVYQGNENSRVIKMTRIKAPTRFVAEEFVSVANANPLTKTKPLSPITTIGDEKILINVSDFSVEKVYISYLRKPITPNIKFKVLKQGDSLVIGKEYEVLSGSVTHQTVTYTKGTGFSMPFFKAESTLFMGDGSLRLKNDGDLELNYQDCLKVINDVVLTFSIDSEQSQSKIQGLAAIANK